MNGVGIILLVVIAVVTGSMVALQMKAFEDTLKLPNNGTWSYEMGEEGQTIVTGFNQTYVIRPSSKSGGSGNGPSYAAQAGETGNETVNATGGVSILVTKVGPGAAHVGEVITYAITVTNNGDTVLDNVWVNDITIGFSQNISSLEPNASNAYNPSYVLNSSHPDPFVNTVVAEGMNGTSGVDSSASWSLDILNPNISVTMSATPKVRGGDSIYITANVTNTGDTDLNVSVTEDKVGNLNGPAALRSGESGTYSGSYAAPNGSKSITFNITAAGVDQLGKRISTSASAITEIISLGINVTTAVTPRVRGGDTIYVAANVTNTGDTDLNMSVAEDKAGSLSGPAVLRSGEGGTYNGTYIAPLGNRSITFTVTAVGVDQLGERITASASATAEIINPGIEVSSIAPEMAQEGDIIQYNISVKNTGDSNLTVNVSDILYGNLFNGVLEPSGVWTNISSYNVTSEPDPLSNTVTAIGIDELGGQVSGSASWSLDILHPNISVTLNATPKVRGGDTIHIAANVTNAGDTDLNMSVAEDKAGSLNGPAALRTGESGTYNGAYAAPQGNRSITFTVAAVGENQLGKRVTASASATAEIIEASLATPTPTKTPTKTLNETSAKTSTETLTKTPTPTKTQTSPPPKTPTITPIKVPSVPPTSAPKAKSAEPGIPVFEAVSGIAGMLAIVYLVRKFLQS